MRSYEIEFTMKAFKQFGDLHSGVQEKLKTRIDSLSRDPRPKGCSKLSGFKDAYRIRVGDYRVIYEVNEELDLVTITRVAHRSSIYKGL